MVEIASLTEHLLTECEWRADFSQCPLCSEALTRDKSTEHAQSAACNRESLYGCTVFLFHAHPERDRKSRVKKLYLSHTIIQSITSSEMCSLHLTHPSAHTHTPAPGEQFGGSVPCSRVSPQSWTIPAGAEIWTNKLGLQVQRSIH